MTELHDLTALEQAAAIRAGEVSPVELTEHYLDRIDRLDARLGAFMTVTADGGMKAAKAAEDLVRTSRRDHVILPPLTGVPTAIKDLTPTAGVRTTYGSRAFGSHVPDADGHVVAALRGAGTICLGKTNTPEFGLGPYTDNDLAGPARTPWDLTRSAGGSSGGAGAA
ncbi:MAG: amidase family protein, partial [Streptosporangiaceae bacterium]